MSGTGEKFIVNKLYVTMIEMQHIEKSNRLCSICQKTSGMDYVWLL